MGNQCGTCRKSHSELTDNELYRLRSIARVRRHADQFRQTLAPVAEIVGNSVSHPPTAGEEDTSPNSHLRLRSLSLPTPNEHRFPENASPKGTFHWVDSLPTDGDLMSKKRTLTPNSHQPTSRKGTFRRVTMSGDLMSKKSTLTSNLQERTQSQQSITVTVTAQCIGALIEFQADSRRLAREREEVKSRSEALSRLRAEHNAEREELSRERAEFTAECNAKREEQARERAELQMMSDKLERESRQLKLRSGSTFAQPAEPKHPQKPKVKTAIGMRDSILSVPEPVRKQAAPVTKTQTTAPVTKVETTAPVTKVETTTPVTNPEVTAKRSGPPTELSKLDDRVGVLQRKLTHYEEKVYDLLQTSSKVNSELKLKKLTRLVVRIKKDLATLNLKRYQMRQRKG